jgi:hypothetical protein
MSRLRALLILLALVLLAGCDETRFAQPLAAKGDCESDLRGLWRIVDEPDSTPEFVHVADGCRIRLLRAPLPGEGGVDGATTGIRDVSFRVALARTDGVLHAWLTDRDFHAAGGDTKPAEHHGQPDGFHVFRIEARTREVVVRGVDHVAVAKAIIEGTLRGQVHKSEDGLKNFVETDAAATAQLLRKRWLFRREDPLRLQRVAVDELPASLRRIVQSDAGTAP